MTTVDTSTSAQATGWHNQKKLARFANGVTWAFAYVSSGKYEFSYSSDAGATWTYAAGADLTDVYTSDIGGSIFVAADASGNERVALVYRETGSLDTVLRWGTPNAGRTAITWSTAFTVLAGSAGLYPDVVAHSEGTGWKVHVVWGRLEQSPQYQRVNVTSADVLSLDGSVHTFGLGTGMFGTNTRSFPSIDFHHTGDGVTVQGSTPHLGVAWSSNEATYGGVIFTKATYSGGAWTWGTDRRLDTTRFLTGQTNSDTWLSCRFDGTRWVVAGHVQNSSSVRDLVQWERDNADTTTTTRTLVAGMAAAAQCAYGGFGYDKDGNTYLFGRFNDGTNKIGARKWDRATASVGALTTLDSSSVAAPYLSVRPSYGGNRIDVLFTEGTYDVVFLAAVTLNTAPNAPTSLSPAGSTLDKDITQRFSWSFSDPNGGDTQSAYDLRYRLQGSGTWTTVSGGATQYHDFAAGTFAAGDWEWQVRTTDNGGLVGPYSASAFFTAASAPASPSITAPTNGGTISTESFTVSWTAPAQASYQVRTVADNAGAPNTAIVYQDTGEVVSGTARSRSMPFPTNGRTEHVQVRVRSAGLWSTWASVRVNVSYTRPPAPTVVVTAQPLAAAISLTITNPAPVGSEPAVTSNEVHVRVAAGGRKDVDRPVGGDGVRLENDVNANGTYTDRLPRANTSYEYRVKAIGANGTSSWSAWTAAT